MDNYHQLKNAYPISYTIGRFLLDNYSKEHILEFVNHPNILLKDIDVILNNTNRWVLSQKMV